jgi:TolA-binding protein
LRTRIWSSVTIAALLFLAAECLSAQTDTSSGISGPALLQKGKVEYQSAQYSEALHDFRSIILSPDMTSLHGDAYFWISLSYIALNQLDDASKNLEYFLMNYPDNANLPEAYYQKGRLLFLQGEYEKAIDVLYTFIKTYQDNPYVANGYYWIGESLYQLGHLDDARKVLSVVINQYPTSFKVEAAKYRISLIDLMNREQELLKLLKWSHEEALNAQEDYQRREQAYEQAILAYQRQISTLSGGTAATQASTTASPSAAVTGADQVTSLKAQIAQLQAQIQALNVQGTGASGSTTSAGTEQQLLALKAQALDLEQYYLDWLSSHAGSAQ